MIVHSIKVTCMLLFVLVITACIVLNRHCDRLHEIKVCLLYSAWAPAARETSDIHLELLANTAMLAAVV